MSQTREHLKHAFDKAVQATEAARLHWKGGLNANEVAKKLGVSRTFVFELLNTAKQHGALEVMFDPTKWFEPSISSLVTQFRQKFPANDLEYVDAVELPPQLSCPEGYQPQYDSFLRSILGQIGAKHLLGIIRNNDLVGVGAGIAMESVALEAGKYRQFPSGSYRVVSLQGGHSASLIALQLSAALNSAYLNEQSQPILHLAAPFSEDKPSAQPANMTPDVAIIELGNAIPDYWALPRDLATLVSTLQYDCDRLSEEPTKDKNYHPLLEALSRYSVIRPSLKPLPSYLEERYGRLEYSAQALGEYTNSIPWQEFKGIPKRIAIAGGLHKTFPIWQAIKLGLVNHLIVDAVTAEAVLALPDSLDF